MTKVLELPPAWLVDYGPARDRALRWLGDKYLLAFPINRPRAPQHIGSLQSSGIAESARSAARVLGPLRQDSSGGLAPGPLRAYTPSLPSERDPVR
jgi:hypothetical protein